MLGITKKIGGTAAELAGGFVLALSAGYMLSDTQLAGVASFADISLAGALSLPTSAAVLTGSLLRSIIGGSVGRNIVKIAAMIMILIIKLFFDDREENVLGAIKFGINAKKIDSQDSLLEYMDILLNKNN